MGGSAWGKLFLLFSFPFQHFSWSSQLWAPLLASSFLAWWLHSSSQWGMGQSVHFLGHSHQHYTLVSKHTQLFPGKRRKIRRDLSNTIDLLSSELSSDSISYTRFTKENRTCVGEQNKKITHKTHHPETTNILEYILLGFWLLFKMNFVSFVLLNFLLRFVFA